MAKPFSEWTVLPHGKLLPLEANLYSVSGMMRMPPMGEVERRMTVVRLKDGGLVIYSAIALDDTEMSALERLGRPAYLIVPSDLHRMDAKVWKDRYPTMRVIAPAGARDKVAEVVPVDHTEVEFHDPAVRFFVVPGTDQGEAGLAVECEGRMTLVLNDIIFNLANRPGLSGWLFKAVGMTGDAPHVPPVIRMRLIEDKNALRTQCEVWSRQPNLKRVIVSHGKIITDDLAAMFRRIAEDLAA